MPLVEEPEIVEWPETEYVYVERTGLFQDSAPYCWNILNRKVAEVKKNHLVQSFFAAYKIGNEMVYRAGISVAPPVNKEALPKDVTHTLLPGGKYLQFTLIGNYSQLPEACGKVFMIADQLGVSLRDAFFLEHYANNPDDTPVDQLITHIMLPIV